MRKESEREGENLEHDGASDDLGYIDKQMFPGIENYIGKPSKANLEKPSAEETNNLFEEYYFGNQTRQSYETTHVHREEPPTIRAMKHVKVLNEQEEGESPHSSEIEQEQEEEKIDWQKLALQNRENKGLMEIRASFFPIWKLSIDEQIQHMTKQVIYEDRDLIAFDKPYGMAYSGNSRDMGRPQFDRLLQDVKAHVTPKCERLYLVRAPNRHESGVMLFAKNSAIQADLKGWLEEGKVETFRRMITVSSLPKKVTVLDTPLVKKVKDGDVKVYPLKSNKEKSKIHYVTTRCRTIVCSDYVSYIEAVTDKEIVHQVRAHLYLAHCPLIGDLKYTNNKVRPTRLSNVILKMLNITDSNTRKLPMFLHTNMMTLPPIRGADSIRIQAPIPSHFLFILKKLNMLRH